MIRILLLTIFLVSCASKEISKPREDQITTDMSVFNQRILGYLYRGEMRKDVSLLDRDIYLKLVSQKYEPSELEYVEFLNVDDIELEIKSIKNNFTVCVKSNLSKLVLCDKANSANVDFVSRDIKLQVKEIISKFSD